MSEQKSMVFLLIRNVVIMLLVALVVGLFIFENKSAYVLGLLIGGAATVGKIFMMQNTFQRAVNLPAHQATTIVRSHYMLRYIISFLVLFIGVFTPMVDIIGLAIGLLLMKPAAYIQGTLEPQVPKDGSVEFLEWEEEDDEEKSEFW